MSDEKLRKAVGECLLRFMDKNGFIPLLQDNPPAGDLIQALLDFFTALVYQRIRENNPMYYDLKRFEEVEVCFAIHTFLEKPEWVNRMRLYASELGLIKQKIQST